MKKHLTLLSCVYIAAIGLQAASILAADEEVATTFKYTDPNATKVEVAGEFSNWKILPLTKGEGGTWSTTLHLKPGYYGYKFVVNGEWVLDPANPARKTVNDIENSAVSVGGVQPPAGGGGSVSGKVPVTFTYSDPSAKSVHVAGEFNNWLDNVDGKVTGHAEWQLQNDGAGNWKLVAPLSPGKFKFKYVINGGERWEKDRNLPASADDNSLIEVKAGGAAADTGAVVSGKPAVTFSYSSPGAKSVHVAGEFNSWLDNVDGKVTGHSDWAMQNDGAGNWKLTAPLPPGKFKFKYVINGGERWEQDPAYPASTDGNSIIEVKAGAGQPVAPVAAAAPAQGGVPVSFTYADPSAKTVTVTGEFNHWNASADPLQKDATGIWTATIPLKPGKYQYKFVVDGVWKADPTNPESQDDGLGGKNSVKVVTQ